MIEVEHLTKKYGDLVAVDDLSFTVEKGKIWGLLGPNAAGKTTTMRVLTCYLPATYGKATVSGFDVFEQPNEIKKIIGYLPEVLPLYTDMTVQAYLQFVAEIKQVPRERRRRAVGHALDVCGLGDVQGRLIKNISKGYRQRVGIAQALLHDPQVIILDEPTVGLDPAQIREIRQLISSLRGEHTIILSTHILAEVTQTCDGAVIINDGKLMASGSLEELTSSFRGGNDGVHVRLRDGEDRISELLREIPGVEDVRRRRNEYAVEWRYGTSPIDDILKCIVDKDLGLQEMRPMSMSIEDLYLKIISGGVEQ